MPYYRLNQFLVDSTVPMPCPAASPTDVSAAAEEQLMVCRAHDSLYTFPYVYWAGRRYGGDFLRAYAVDDGVLVCAGQEVKMLVDRQGRRLFLDFDPQDASALACARGLTINLGVSLCTLFRGDLPLHAAGVEIGGKLIGIMAPSGTGKSTLLWTLLDRGARFANDDVIPIRVDKAGVTAIPSFSLPARLSKKGMENRGMDWTNYEETLPGEEEFWIPIKPQDRLLSPTLLAALFVLQPFRCPELPGQIFVRRQTGPSALSLLLANTQGMWAAYGLLDAGRLFSQYAALMQSVPLYTLEYLRCFEVLPDIVRIIREVVVAEPQKAASSSTLASQAENPDTYFQRWLRSRSSRRRT